jgi:hypothetical protein
MPVSGPNQMPTFRRPIRADAAMACPWVEGVLALKGMQILFVVLVMFSDPLTFVDATCSR